MNLVTSVATRSLGNISIDVVLVSATCWLASSIALGYVAVTLETIRGIADVKGPTSLTPREDAELLVVAAAPYGRRLAFAYVLAIICAAIGTSLLIKPPSPASSIPSAYPSGSPSV